MKTINNFILERLKLNNDSKINKQNKLYKLLVIPYGENYSLLKKKFNDINNSKLIKCIYLGHIRSYIIDRNFFIKNILNDYENYESLSYIRSSYHGVDTIVKIFENDINDLIDNYKNINNSKKIVNEIRSKFELVDLGELKNI